jgi:peptidoglycan hydrolase CwlO-like protein
MNDTITQRQLLEQRIRQTQAMLSSLYGKRQMTPERADELRAKLARYQQELTAL